MRGDKFEHNLEDMDAATATLTTTPLDAGRAREGEPFVVRSKECAFLESSDGLIDFANE